MTELKPGWRRFRFEELAVNVNDRVDDPRTAGVDRYVGLEHLDPEDLTIRRWGTPDDVEAQKLRFKPGDIIFGKRRAYQRKLAVADFEGICSAHAMVLRARPEAVLPEFLPFFMQSDVFMERAKAISVGSLSPTINWRTLATEEFLLPPLEEQQRLHRVLLAASAACWAAKDARMAAEATEVALAEDFIASSQQQVPIGEVVSDIAYGCSMKSSSERTGLPILRIPNVLRGELSLDDLQWIELNADDSQRFGVLTGDVLLVRTNGNPDYVGRSVHVPPNAAPMVFASYLLRLRVKPGVLPEFLSAMINAPSTRRGLRRSVRSSAGNFNINTSGVSGQTIPCCGEQEQKSLVDRLRSMRSARLSLDKRAQSLADLCRNLLREGLA